jgi:glycolate oxidase FAD binding subunit
MALVAASSASDVRDAILAANAASRTLAVQAGASKASLGHPAPGDDTLDVRGIVGVVDYDPAELVLTARAGTPLAEIEALLAQRGQHLAFEPPTYAALLGSNGVATLGGTLAANASGPRRIAAGGARDHFLGVQAVSGQGDAFKAGGRVVKNVTGYDLPKLLAGSFGTLAVMTEVTLKVLPAPETSATVLVRGLAAEAAVALMTGVTGTALDCSGLAHLSASATARSAVGAVRSAGAAITLLRLEGIASSVAARREALRASAGSDTSTLEDAASTALWQEVRELTVLPAGGIVWRLSVPPHAGAAVARAIANQTDGEILFDWAGGLLWLALPGSAAKADVVRAAIASCGGHATLMRAPAEVRHGVAVFQPQPASVAALSRRVKAAFDPAGVLNPGRMVV